MNKKEEESAILAKMLAEGKNEHREVILVEKIKQFNKITALNKEMDEDSELAEYEEEVLNGNNLDQKEDYFNEIGKLTSTIKAIKSAKSNETPESARYVFLSGSDSCLEVLLREDKPILIERKREEEKQNFFVWTNEKQICGQTSTKNWVFSVFSAKQKLAEDKIRVKGTGKHAILSIDCILFLSVAKSNELIRVEYSGKTLKILNLGKTTGKVKSVAKNSLKVFVGTSKGTVEQFAGNRRDTILKTKQPVESIKLVNDSLWVVDSAGCTIQMNLTTLQPRIAFQLKQSGIHFFSQNTLVSCKEDCLVLYNLEGKFLKTLDNPSKNSLILIENNNKFALLASTKGDVLLWSHSTLSFEHVLSSPIDKIYFSS